MDEPFDAVTGIPVETARREPTSTKDKASLALASAALCVSLFNAWWTFGHVRHQVRLLVTDTSNAVLPPLPSEPGSNTVNFPREGIRIDVVVSNLGNRNAVVLSLRPQVWELAQPSTGTSLDKVAWPKIDGFSTFRASTRQSASTSEDWRLVGYGLSSDVVQADGNRWRRWFPVGFMMVDKTEFGDFLKGKVAFQAPMPTWDPIELLAGR